MNRDSRGTNRRISELRFLIAGLCTAVALAFATHASAALTVVGPSAFTGAVTTLTFEDLSAANDNAPITVYHGVTFNGGTIQELYSDYGGSLVSAASAAGLGNNAATFGCTGTCGTGFTLPTAQTLVGLYLSSNVDITNIQVSAYRSGALLGSQTLTVLANQIGFAGFQDPSGIDQIVIGNNTSCPSCIHQLDNVLFGSGSSAAIPTLSQSGIIILATLLALGAILTLRRRRQ